MHHVSVACLTPPVANLPYNMRILSIDRAAGPDDRVMLRLETGKQVEVARELLVRAGLHAGDDLAPDRLERIAEEDARWRAREAALRLLAHRPRAESELRLRLVRKGFAPEVAEECLDQLKERGLLDDASFAEMFARDRVRLSPRGRRRVVQELRGRGVEPEVANAAVEGVMREEETDELTLARQAAGRWRRRTGEEPIRARRRLQGFLARRGFGPDAVREVVEEVLGSE